MTAITYKEFYNKDRGLPEPVWGQKTKKYKPPFPNIFGPISDLISGLLGTGTPLQCPVCGSIDIYYSAHPDDPEEILKDTVRCKNCGHITDWYEAYKQGKCYPVDTPMEVIHENPACSVQGMP